MRGLGRREGTGAGRAVTALCVRFGRRVCPQGFHGPSGLCVCSACPQGFHGP